MPTRREFLHAALWTAGACWLGGGALHAASLASGEKLHTVRRGDTLSGIARDHGTTVSALRTRNRLRSDRILVGQRLVVPAPTAARAAPPAVLAPVIAATKGLRIGRNRWRTIVAHHSGIEAGNAAAYDRNHRERGMEHGLAYHFVIGNGRDSGDGEIEVGPRWVKQLRGGHVRDQDVNETGIGICLVGNFQERRPGRTQLASFTALVDYLREDVLPNPVRFTIHRLVDRNHTVCPGRHFPYETYRRRYA